ncbi:MAG: selenide, water dikinase SelD [Bacteroidales bacterium]|jgi:selenide,water dikinase|nr:selenide, water dikinase SelD [Bacteroidales bacterium]MBP8642901.1 selenide, water dikinase SelD [Bacteroidales bacterium]HPG99920.1 selenide, water dikinase SelD [Tenuifilaceae bacterium]HPM89166.1 selenide, water dikinase SelD [Tenuifilaceae bacterium]
MMEEFDLLSTVEQGGCSSKIPAALLESLLPALPKLVDENILVDFSSHDDAGVYRISDDFALILTTDFFPPVCSDPFEFGQISAANSISDVYAMGGEPFLALNISMFPSSRIPIDVYKSILEGAASKALEANVAIIGGHTIDDFPPKFGLAVVGRVDPKRLVTNSGLRPGDKLILTKPLGTGITVAAKRLKMVTDESYRIAIQWMKTLNDRACSVMKKYHVTGATDITGFGLLGHLLRMARSSRVNISIQAGTLPVLPGVTSLVNDGCIPGAAFRNLEYVENDVTFTRVDYDLKMIMVDAQTSGGLLMGVQDEFANQTLQELTDAGLCYSRIIGEVGEGNGKIFVS